MGDGGGGGLEGWLRVRGGMGGRFVRSYVRLFVCILINPQTKLISAVGV